jgi:ribosome-binding ATPase YchF (GTP1/OBG family)
MLRLLFLVGAEADITELESHVFSWRYGVNGARRSVLIRAAYKLLTTKITAGVKEVRAWTIDVINCPTSRSDSYRLRKGFIPKLLLRRFRSVRSEAKCKEAGKFKVEGKEYVVKDGDVMHFRFN